MTKIPKLPIIFQIFTAAEKDWLSHAFVFGFALAKRIWIEQNLRAMVVFQNDSPRVLSKQMATGMPRD